MTSQRRIALVTGGAKRIGQAIAESLAEAGFAVALHCNRSRAEAEALAERLRGDGRQASVITGDLADLDAVPRILDEAASQLGAPTLLVNSASMFEPDGIGDFDAARFQRQLAINLTAPVLLADAFANALPKGEAGLIVNIIDQRVWKTTPHHMSYQLSKSGLLTATRTLAQALAPRKIRVNAIGPGPTLASARQDETDFRRQAAAVPLGHGPELAEFGRTVLFLHATPSITGQMIALDGGQHLAWETPDVVGIKE